MCNDFSARRMLPSMHTASVPHIEHPGSQNTPAENDDNNKEGPVEENVLGHVSLARTRGTFLPLFGHAVSRFPLRPPGRRRVSELGQPLRSGKRPSIGISHRMSTLMTGRPASSRRAQRTGWREIAELPFRYERRGNACERVKWRLPIRFGGW